MLFSESTDMVIVGREPGPAVLMKGRSLELSGKLTLIEYNDDDGFRDALREACVVDISPPLRLAGPSSKEQEKVNLSLREKLQIIKMKNKISKTKENYSLPSDFRVMCGGDLQIFRNFDEGRRFVTDLGGTVQNNNVTSKYLFCFVFAA